jgi:hypothetical protein
MFNFNRSRLENFPIINKENRLYKMEKLLLGKTYDEAIKLYSNLRIVKNEGVSQIITMDLCKDRCNIIIEERVITEISGFY